MRQKFWTTSAVVLLLLTMAISISAQDDRLQIVASHSILADVVSQVVGDVADVTALMPNGADPHSYQPTPSDLTMLASADVVFINGALFEEGMSEAIENAGDEMNIVTASSCVSILAFGDHDHDDDDMHDDDHSDEADHDHDHSDEADHDHDHSDEADHDHDHNMSELSMLCEQHIAEMAAIHGHDDDHDHNDEEAHDHEDEGEEAHDHSHYETLGLLHTLDCSGGHDHEADDDGHNHGACDPHVWMNPHNVMYWTMLIRDTLIELDPAHTDVYTANADTYLTELDSLAHDFIMPMVETVAEENRVMITNHASFGYFAASYDFEVATTVIPGGSTVADPSAADIAAVIDLIREEGVPAVFAETTVRDDIAQQIADETGAQVYLLYTGSLSNADEPAGTYLDYMRYNVTTIVEALGGGM